MTPPGRLTITVDVDEDGQWTLAVHGGPDGAVAITQHGFNVDESHLTRALDTVDALLVGPRKVGPCELWWADRWRDHTDTTRRRMTKGAHAAAAPTREQVRQLLAGRGYLKGFTGWRVSTAGVLWIRLTSGHELHLLPNQWQHLTTPTPLEAQA